MTFLKWEKSFLKLKDNSLRIREFQTGIPIETLKVSKTESMKKVYTRSDNPSGKMNLKPVVSAISIPKAWYVQLRGYVAVIFSFLFIFLSINLHAQNCPTIGTNVVSVSENTYYPGTQAIVSAGATSITLGAIGAGSNFGNTPIASGDIVLIIQM